MSQRKPRPLSRPYAHATRLALREAAGTLTADPGPHWAVEHRSPPRRVRRAWAQVMHDHSGKSRAKQVMRIMGVDALTAALMLKGAVIAKRDRRPPLANDAAAHEKLRHELQLPYSGGRHQSAYFNEAVAPMKRSRAEFLRKREIARAEAAKALDAQEPEA